LIQRWAGDASLTHLPQGNAEQDQAAAHRVVEMQRLAEQHDCQHGREQRYQIHQRRGLFRAQRDEPAHP